MRLRLNPSNCAPRVPRLRGVLTGSVVHGIDHVYVPLTDAQAAYRVLTETLGLPIAWPYTAYGDSTSGAVNLGNLNPEMLRDSAAVDGFAVGGGLEITMACDFVLATDRARWGMPEVGVGITAGWGGTTRMARLIGRRMTKDVNLLGALHPTARAVHLGLWNRVVPDDTLDAEVDALVDVLLSKNQQAVHQLKFIINRRVEADLYTAQGFETLSAGLSGAVNGAWQVADADRGNGITAFAHKSSLWQQRRALAREFWSDGPNVVASTPAGLQS